MLPSRETSSSLLLDTLCVEGVYHDAMKCLLLKMIEMFPIVESDIG
jgi:hypothetical protein